MMFLLIKLLESYHISSFDPAYHSYLMTINYKKD